MHDQVIIELDVICQLKEMSIKGNDEDSGDEGFLDEDKPRETVTFDELNAFVVQLKSLEFKISKLGWQYQAVTLAVRNEFDNLLSIYCKNEKNQLSRKQKEKVANQILITAFIDK